MECLRNNVERIKRILVGDGRETIIVNRSPTIVPTKQSCIARYMDRITDHLKEEEGASQDMCIY
jgi:hypothetical protein